MRFYILIPVIVFFISAKAQVVNTFSFTIDGSTPAGFPEALTVAGQKWSDYLQINVPVKVNVYTVNSSLLPFSAITLANGRQNFSGAPFANYLYPTALANQITGNETNMGEADMDIYFNLATPYYYGPGKPPSNARDFITTAMHEIGHGLGFYSDGYVDGDNKGSFGNIPPSSIFPLSPSFPWRGQDGVPAIYDKYIVKQSNNFLTTSAPDNSTALGDSIKNGALYFSGPLYANPSHSNTPVRLSGGAGTFTLGVDLLHIHNTYANTIMSYYWGDGDTVRIPAPWELGILKEIGWELKVVGLTEHQNLSMATVYPSPASNNVYIRAKNISSVKVYNMLGELLSEKPNRVNEEEAAVNTEGLEGGIYFFTISFSNSANTVIKKILISR